jgi:hypothetical protein
MTEKKYSLKIVNKGKPFVMPKWTVGKHRAAMSQMLAECKDMSEEEKTEEFNYYVIYQTLKQIDNDVSLEDIKTLHPEDLIQLFNDVYNAGKEGIYFRKGKKPKTKKSTGKKK